MARLRGSVHDDTINGYNGGDRVWGGYGNDALNGGGGNDRLNGGRGNDVVNGGDGNDIIISKSDGGETPIAQDVNANNDPNGEVDAATRMIYANQAGLPSDDILTGGAGADEFRIMTLINAKREILEKHADPNTGIIDYSMNGVAGENNLVHDHWVDSIGNDIITDFNKAEGDKLTIAGHTTEVYQIDITDTNGDGIDDTVLHLRSNQGANGGAHHLDLLGTVTVLNNQLTANDFTVDAGAHYGIVENISQLNEAISPLNPSASAPNPDTGENPDAGENPDTGTDPGAGGGEDPGTDPGTDTGANPVPVRALAALFAVPEDVTPAEAPTSGDDVLVYGDGGERGNGGRGNDMMIGGAGNDSLSGGWGDDLIEGGGGNDHIHGGHGDDVISGGDGDDLITGDFGSDILHGGAGNDTLRGGRGEDVLFGGAGDDVLAGGASDDILMGGAGNDTINGGRGTDTLLLAGSLDDYTFSVGNRAMQITDGNGETDTVTRVEQFHFLGTGETYTLRTGQLALSEETDALDDLISDHLIEDLIAEEVGADDSDVVDLDQGAPTDPVPADDATDTGSDAPTPPVAEVPDLHDHGSLMAA